MEREGGKPMYFGYLRSHQGQHIRGTWARTSMSDSEPGPLPAVAGPGLRIHPRFAERLDALL